jgi:hypothetical protein
MSTLTVEETRVKDLLKLAVMELFQERKDLLSDLLTEVIEDLALARAIKEGETSESVSRAQVWQVLDGVA